MWREIRASSKCKVPQSKEILNCLDMVAYLQLGACSSNTTVPVHLPAIEAASTPIEIQLNNNEEISLVCFVQGRDSLLHGRWISGPAEPHLVVDEVKSNFSDGIRTQQNIEAPGGIVVQHNELGCVGFGLASYVPIKCNLSYGLNERSHGRDRWTVDVV